jgi:hypothetical protein
MESSRLDDDVVDIDVLRRLVEVVRVLILFVESFWPITIAK